MVVTQKCSKLVSQQLGELGEIVAIHLTEFAQAEGGFDFKSSACRVKLLATSAAATSGSFRSVEGMPG